MADTFFARSRELRDLLGRARAAVGAKWYADDIVPGQVGGPDVLILPDYSVADFHALADQLKHAAREFHYAAQAVAAANPLPM